MIAGKMPAPPLKHVVWLGDSLRELRTFPAAVQDEMGYAIYLAQRGDKRGRGGQADTWRPSREGAEGAGKSKSGIATPKAEIELIKQRLRQAIEIAKKKE